jgi:hypothetical protein
MKNQETHSFVGMLFKVGFEWFDRMPFSRSGIYAAFCSKPLCVNSDSRYSLDLSDLCQSNL